MWQTYHTPQSLEEALQLLAEYQTDARIMAGGTDLMVELERGLRSPQVIIDISRIPNLDTISQDDHNIIHLGPLVTHNQVVRSSLCVDRAFPLAKACWEIGAPQIRNRATIAGNLVTASPANDTITPLWVLGATITLQSVQGKRSLPFEAFFLGVRETAIKPDEMVVDIAVPPLAAYEVGTFLKLGLRRFQAISVVNVAAKLNMLGDTVTGARLALGSVAPTIIRVPDAERFLSGKVLTPEVIARAGELAAQTIGPISDVRGSAEYRRYMAATLTRHALDTLATGTESDTFPRRPVVLWGKTDGRFARRPAASLTHSSAAGSTIETEVNGQVLTLKNAAHKSLLRLLREDANLTGTKEGCAEGECGACTVLLDGIAVMSCMVPAPRAHGCQITTIEGLAKDDRLHPLQQAFVDEAAVQCGYCTPGLIMSGAALLDECFHPTRDEMKQAITGNLCRCTGYYKILKALETAARTQLA